MSNLPDLFATDIINQINMCLKSDAVYVCNSNGILDKYTMFVLGYLMAKKRNIKFIQNPNEVWLVDVVNHFTKPNNQKLSPKYKKISYK